MPVILLVATETGISCSTDEPHGSGNSPTDFTFSMSAYFSQRYCIFQIYELPSSEKKEGEENKDADLDDLDPKLREAMLKMRKLDRILIKKMKREKEVKRDRLRLQKR